MATIADKLKATMAQHNANVAKANTLNGITSGNVSKNKTGSSALDVYNGYQSVAGSTRRDFAGNIQPYISAAAYSQAQADAFNAEQAQINRDWQMSMSSTAHQREVADLKAAGLNPIISAYGQGASTGSGATASSTNQLTGVLGNMAMSALNAVSSLSQAQLANATQSLTAQKAADASKYVANVNAQTQVYVTKLNNMNALTVARIAGEYNLKSTQVSAYASQYAAELANAASIYASNKSYQATMDSKPVESLVKETRDTLGLSVDKAKDVVSDVVKWLVPTVKNTASNVYNFVMQDR